LARSDLNLSASRSIFDLARATEFWIAAAVLVISSATCRKWNTSESTSMNDISVLRGSGLENARRFGSAL
jgi:hypothetical protein